MVAAAALVQRAVTVLVMAWTLGWHRLVPSLVSWDAVDYREVATSGYHLASPGHLTNLVFFPLYPALVRLGSAVPFVSTSAALLGIAFISSIVAALPIYAIGCRLHSPGTGWLLAMLWGAMPQAFVLVMGYPEGLFTAATAFVLLFMLRGQPLAAAGAVVAAGLIRPAALPLVFVVMLWCVLNLRHNAHWRRWLAAAVIAPLGLAGVLVYVSWRMGSVFGYFQVQHQWNLRFGTPWQFFTEARQLFTSTSPFLVSVDVYVPVVFAFIALTILLLGRIRRSGYLWITIYTALSTALILTRATYFWSESREFLPLFPLLLPLATIKSSRWAWLAVVAVATVGMALFGAAVLSAHQYSV